MKALNALISELKNLRKEADCKGMFWTVDDINNTIDKLGYARMRAKKNDVSYIDHMSKVDKRKHPPNRKRNSVTAEENVHLAIQQLTDIACSSMESMSSEEISRANNEYNFKRYPTLHAAADSCTGLIESYDIDSRDLSVAFGNEFTYTQHTNTYDEHNKMFDDVSKNGEYVIDVPHDQILSAMSQMQYLARKKSPKWVKSNFHIPKKAYETYESFNTFMKKFYKKHGIFCPE